MCLGASFEAPLLFLCYSRLSNLGMGGQHAPSAQRLQFTHAGKVDCIYIDPPYNSGARDWKYDNNYVDDTDAYRHSKWLAFMERRLSLAKPLLNPQRLGKSHDMML